MAYSLFGDGPNLGLWSWLVTTWSGQIPQLDNVPMRQRAHDWPSNGSGPRGQECCDCVLYTGNPPASCAIQYESFAPQFGGVNTQGGNGGDILVVTTDNWIKIIATEDGGRPGQLYYFVGPGLGMPGNGPGGWVICGPNIAQDSWNSCITQLCQSYPGPTNPIGNLTPAYTRYLWGSIDIPYLYNGVVYIPLNLPCLVSEHYSTADPSTSPEMERFIYAPWFGKVRWEYWTLTGTPLPGAMDRAPPMVYGWPTPDATGNMHLTDARTYTNFWNDENFTVNPGAGWPVGLVLP